VKFMKILYIFPSGFNKKIEFGGSITHVSGMILAFLKKGFALSLVMPNNHNIMLSCEKIIVYPSLKIPLFEQLRYKNDIRKKIKIKDYDIIYARASGLVLIPFDKNKINILEYNSDYFWSKWYWSGNILKKICAIIEWPCYYFVKHINFNNANIIITISKANKKHIPKKYQDKILVLPNGVNIENYLCEIDQSLMKSLNIKNNVVIGMVSSFGLWHGSEVLAKSIKEIVAKNSKVRFLFIGNGLRMPQVQEIIKKEKLEQHVIFVGEISPDKIPAYLSICDILVNPTVPNPDGTEFFGSPTKLFEYMASGKAIISSEIGQMKEILENEKDCVFCKSGDVQDLANKINMLISDKILRIKLGLNARKKVERKYTWDKNVDSLFELIKYKYNSE